MRPQPPLRALSGPLPLPLAAEARRGVLKRAACTTPRAPPRPLLRVEPSFALPMMVSVSSDSTCAHMPSGERLKRWLPQRWKPTYHTTVQWGRIMRGEQHARRAWSEGHWRTGRRRDRAPWIPTCMPAARSPRFAVPTSNFMTIANEGTPTRRGSGRWSQMTSPGRAWSRGSPPRHAAAEVTTVERGGVRSGQRT